MRKFCLAILGLVLLTGRSAADDSVTGEALVRDAVTIAVAGARFRLVGIMPPGTQTCGGKVCNEVAVQLMGAKLAGHQVTCIKERRLGHGYFLAQCKLDDGSDIAKLILEEGLSMPERSAPAAYSEASEKARSQARGLWSQK